MEESDDADMDSDSDSDSSSTSSGSESDRRSEQTSDTSGLASPTATQYEQMRDGNFKHLRHELDDDHRMATQRLQARPTRVGDNHMADNGILESITCINFMCHDHLRVDLGPLLNFIVGENGSGKSAILTAITLCLGGKASTTNRGGSLRSFIKEGRDSALLIVSIKNQGVDAYQPQVYGDSIIVERHFTRSGASGFKIKSARGKVISTKRSEIDEIVEYYALQVDNPINVLSQDMARQFLNSSSPAQKYKFFVQGVQLEQLDVDYRILNSAAEGVLLGLERYKPFVEQRQKEHDEALRRQELIRNNESLRERSILLRNKLCWAQVVEQETILHNLDRDIAAANEEVAAKQQECDAKGEQLDALAETLRRREEELEQVKAEKKELDDKAAEAREAFSEQQAKMSMVHKDERVAHTALKAQSDRVEEIKKKIRDEERRIEEVNGGANARKKMEMDEARKRLDDIEAQIEENRRLARAAEERKAAAAKEAADSKAALDRKKVEKAAAADRLRALERGRPGPWDGYEPAMQNLVSQIERDSGFEHKPVGPIGKYVRLLKPAWSSIIETTFGRALTAFVVTNKRDQARLSAMMGRLRMQNRTIFIVPNRHIDTTAIEPDRSFDTILRVLRIENELVRNALIINFKPEKSILIEDLREATRVMFDGAAPRNVTACYAIRPHYRNHGVRLVNTNGNLDTAPVEPNSNQRTLIQSDSGEELAFQRQALQALEQEYQDLEKEDRLVRQREQRAAHEAKQLAAAKIALERDRRNTSNEIDQLQADLDSFDGADSRLESLRQNLAEANESKEVSGQSYGELVVRKKEMNAVVERYREQMKAAKDAARQFEARIAKAEERVQKAASMRQITLAEKNEAFRQLDKAKETVARLQRKRAEQAVHVETFTREAEENGGPRVEMDPGETHEIVEAQYNSLMQQLDQRRRRMGMSDEEVHNRVTETRLALDEACRGMESMRMELALLKQTLRYRLEKWRTFQRLSASCTRVNFIYLLSERGFRGQLQIDHRSRRLQVTVEPDEAVRKGTGRSTTTLSGGEKSFSSVCLLLSVWESMGSPLRCLDEFDVFMDNVNRSISTKMLVDTARLAVGKQFILITPNAIEGAAHLGKDVKIIRLVFPSHPLYPLTRTS